MFFKEFLQNQVYNEDIRIKGKKGVTYMLTIFNRVVVYSTYTKENLERVKEILDKENIEYLVRTTKSEFGYDELGDTYQLYVHEKDVEEAQRFVTEVLFPKHE